MEIQVSTLGGGAQKIQLPSEATWADLQVRLAQQFGVPASLQLLTRDEEVLRLGPEDDLQSLGVSPDEVLTLVRIHRAWLWADAEGACVDPEASSDQYSHKGLERLFEWVYDQIGEDSCAEEEVRAGVIYVPSGRLPATSEEMLRFLSGDGGAHSPVLPGVTGKDGEEAQMDDCPWIDIAELAVASLRDLWPPKEKRPDRHYQRVYDQIVHPPRMVDAARALVCAGRDATDEEVDGAVEQCTFFACMHDAAGVMKGGLVPEDKLAGFFNQDCRTPYVIVCANPVKSTIAFCYQVSYWV